MKRLILIMALLALASPAWGATYYVNQAGSGGGTGLDEANAASITTFNNAAGAPFDDLAGDTVYFLGTITTAPGLVSTAQTASNRAVLRGDYPGNPVDLRARFLASGKSNFDLIGLNSTNSPQQGIYLIKPIDATVTDCIIQSSTDHGVHILDGSGVTLTRITATGVSVVAKAGIFVSPNTSSSTGFYIDSCASTANSYGIYLGAVSTFVVNGGMYSSNKRDGIVMTASGVSDCESVILNAPTCNYNGTAGGGLGRGLSMVGSVIDATAEIKNITVNGGSYDGNYESGIEITGNSHDINIYGPGTSSSNGVDGSSTYGTGLEIYSTNPILMPYDVFVYDWEANYNSGPDGVGYRFDDSSYNCGIYRSKAAYNEGFGMAINTSNGGCVFAYGVLAYNNTDANANWGNADIHDITTGSSIFNCTMIGGVNGVYDGTGAGVTTSNRIVNNIIVDATVGIKGVAGCATVENYNDIYNCVTVRTNIAAGANTITSDPLFLAPSAGNYRVLRTSPAVDAGTNDADGDGVDDASGTDLGGTAYPSNGTRDIGAYEYDYQLWSVDSKKFRGIP